VPNISDSTSRHPDLYGKEEDSNLNKLYRTFDEEIDLLRNDFEDVIQSRDLDWADDKILDRIGFTLGVPRDGRSDVEYRNALKIEITANQSPGDIETMIEISRTLLGDDVFNRLIENWDNEPASFMIYYDYFELFSQAKEEYANGTFEEVSDMTRSIAKILNRAKAAGVDLILMIYMALKNEFDVNEALKKDIIKSLSNDASATENVYKNFQKTINEGAFQYLDGTSGLDGDQKLDGSRPRMAQILNPLILKTINEDASPVESLFKKLIRGLGNDASAAEKLSKTITATALNNEVSNKLDGGLNLNGGNELNGVRELVSQSLNTEVI